MPQDVVGVKGFLTTSCVLVTDLQTTYVFRHDVGDMLQKSSLVALLLTAGFLTSCGTSTTGPEGSKHETQTGISETGYPGGQPTDAESPSLGSSSEQKYARTEAPGAEADATPSAK
jgi:hypothetical protein